ncbi:Polyketide cyclase/dehydrase and lipid transport superfamily protein [Rhynchospora pubera]|uniref:Polyketide cyclase/dehydrase and lipid transport superfamily protein n=1 Tax=Rhynchospora pubera TaxID=906938 RepID=A0AAV8FXA5_9POAL|nr:Polyketide cyclase/dehydrase and lipid transport superfamily protein [Rhynchospora pubera]KAJ4797908.1 Polyketide cyclase/dehydrase and lipid transport superfamily protein [Rhynchospora pubera]KAJ4809512.1 Polyketide cyclase/dehydrase and lipid transport superfamily protein [Rhynchospora pubera]
MENMNMMRGEIALNMSAEKAWEVFTSNDKLSKVDPLMLSSAEYIQGDGSPGSLRLFKLGPALQNFVKESVQKIEKVEAGRCLAYQVVDGQLHEMYDPYRVTFSFTPVVGKETEQCTVEWKAEFMPLSPETPPPEKAKDAALGFLKSFEKSEVCN